MTESKESATIYLTTGINNRKKITNLKIPRIHYPLNEMNSNQKLDYYINKIYISDELSKINNEIMKKNYEKEQIIKKNIYTNIELLKKEFGGIYCSDCVSLKFSH